MLCDLACAVLSKPLGIGASERSWKDVKKILMPTRNKTDHGRSVKMTTIVGEHCADKVARCRERENCVGRLWTEEDFETLKLDKYGIEVVGLAGD